MVDGRIRVCRIIARMNVGGPALQVAGLWRGLDQERYETLLIHGAVEPGEADYLSLRAPDVGSRLIPELGRALRPGDDLRAMRAILQAIRGFQPHIVHTHTAKAGVLGRVAARMARVPYVVHTFHGHLLHGYFSRPATAAVVRVERGLARITDRLVSVGSQVRDDLLRAGIGKPQQWTVVPPGVRLPEPPTRSEARRVLGLPDDGLVVAYVARLTAIKRPDRFARVALELASRSPDVRFAVAGEGPELCALQDALRPIEGRVYFLGWRSDVETVYAAADLALLTSDNEGMPVSLIEAATVGRPCVATDVGSVAEVVLNGATGLLTGTADGELVEATLRLLRERGLREAMGRAAAEHSRAAFSVERLVRDTDRIYQGLVNDSSPEVG